MTIGIPPPDNSDPFRRQFHGDRHAQHAPPGLGAFSLLLDGMQQPSPGAAEQKDESKSELKRQPERRDADLRAHPPESTLYAGPVGQEARETLRAPAERERPEHNAGSPPHQRSAKRPQAQAEPAAQPGAHDPARAETQRDRQPVSEGRETLHRQPATPQGDAGRDQSVQAAATVQTARASAPRESGAEGRAAVARLASAGAVQAARAQPAQPVQPAAGAPRSEARADARQVAQQRPAQQPQRPDTEKFIEQAQRGLAHALQRKDGEVTMRLHPEALGKLTVQVRVEASTVHARVEATTEAAREMLMSHSPALRAALESRGLEVQRLEITLAPEARSESGPRFAMSDDADRHAGSNPGQADHGGGRGSDTGSGRSPEAGRETSAEDRAQQHTSAAWRSPGSLLIDTVA